MALFLEPFQGASRSSVRRTRSIFIPRHYHVPIVFFRSIEETCSQMGNKRLRIFFSKLGFC